MNINRPLYIGLHSVAAIALSAFTAGKNFHVQGNSNIPGFFFNAESELKFHIPLRENSENLLLLDIK